MLILFQIISHLPLYLFSEKHLIFQSYLEIILLHICLDNLTLILFKIMKVKNEKKKKKKKNLHQIEKNPYILDKISNLVCKALKFKVFDDEYSRSF